MLGVAPRSASWTASTSASRAGRDHADLTVHADRGAAATLRTVADLLDAIGVRRSFSRPRVGDDSSHIEAHFKHLKYAP